ncbi:helix-turn-helix domain-containing protein [Actinoallomurus purpureus]|uniref:helix-turn-helix domain-containing protein n=1 Tax=Actinoallomurus purpureus TaxID=478114 RepID=UPI0020925F89|nr:helix-turn-helix domain-containing protein [Actinoallomurus purpureus]MCO6010091.1 helix-turn-helix domain-containing protein [Actinoallomurus purpureus]
MDLRPDLSIGDRLKVARRHAEQTQEQLAERSGVNVDTIRKLEQGQRQSARVSTMNALANALGIETSALLFGVAEQEPARQDPNIKRIRKALAPVHDFAPAVDHAEEDEAPDVTTLRRGIEDAWGNYHAGDFVALGEILPDLITEARVATREHTNGTATEANGVLAKALQLGAHTMVQSRHEDLALLGLARAQAPAERSGSPLMPAMLANSVSWIFLRTGRLADSERVAVATADGIEPSFRSSPPGHVAVYGGLLLSGLTAAARHERYDDARELLAVARAAADRIGDDSTDRWTTVFGPTSVAMQAASVEAAAGNWGNVLAMAERVPLSGKTPVSWKVRFLLDIAHARAETYRDADAVETLRTIRAMAPGWIRRHGLAVAIVRQLLDRPKPPRGIFALADFLGVAH